MNGQLARYRAFQEVARTKSFTEAAIALGYSQSAVSRLVSELEREWGVQLFERSRAGVSLTNEGAQLLPAANALCQAEAEFHAQVDGLHNLSSGLIRIGTISSTATHWLPHIISSFQSEYPGIRYELFLGDYAQLSDALSSGRIDCAFTRLPVEGSMVEAGLGVSVLPSLVLRRSPYHIAVLPLSPRFFRTLGFVTRKTAATPLAVERFMEHLGKRND